MSQTSDAIRLLKAQLKAKGVTHQVVADQLGVKLATVRRWLDPKEKTVRMENFERMCEIADTSFAQLLQQLEEVKGYELDELDETAFLQDKLLMLIGFLVINGWSYDQIADNYLIEKKEILDRLVFLQNIGAIQKLDNETGNFDLVFTSKFSWKVGGRIETEVKKIVSEFIAKPVDHDTDKEVFIPFMLSKEASMRINDSMDSFIDQLHKVVQVDSYNSEEDREGYSFFLSKKKWIYSEFKTLSKR